MSYDTKTCRTTKKSFLRVERLSYDKESRTCEKEKAKQTHKRPLILFFCLLNLYFHPKLIHIYFDLRREHPCHFVLVLSLSPSPHIPHSIAKKIASFRRFVSFVPYSTFSWNTIMAFIKDKSIPIIFAVNQSDREWIVQFEKVTCVEFLAWSVQWCQCASFICFITTSKSTFQSWGKEDLFDFLLVGVKLL